MRKIQIQHVPIDGLLPYARNAKQHPPEQVAQIAASIKEFGFNNPVLIDGENGIIAGHGRVLAARKLGLDSVPCLALNHLTPAQKRAYIIADNRLGDSALAPWDWDMLQAEIDSLKEENYDYTLTGFDDESLAAAVQSVESGLYGAEEDRGGDGGENYSRKVEAPIYEPQGDPPPLSALFDETKTDELKAEIRKKNLPADIAAFLSKAADRHTVFNFREIANYYAHADAEVQNLMERSALIIIDFNRAIEEGFVKLTAAVAEQYAKDYPDDEE